MNVIVLQIGFPICHLLMKMVNDKLIINDFSLPNLVEHISIYVMRSSKMSLNSKIFVSCFLAFSIRVLFKLSFGENPMEIGQLILEK